MLLRLRHPTFGQVPLNTGTITESTSFDAKNDIRTAIPRFEPDALKHNRAVVDLLAAGLRGRARGECRSTFRAS
jgi:hypothetical protein